MRNQTNNFGSVEVDLLQLTKEQESLIVSATKQVTEYLKEQETVKDSIKETLEMLITDLGATKDSSKAVKKYTKLLAKHNLKQDKEAVVTGNHILETLLERLDRNLVDQYSQ